MDYLITFFVETNVDEYKRQASLPFIPQIGMFIDLGDGFSRKVEEVYYFCPDGIWEIWFEFDGGVTKKLMKQGGWFPA